MSEDIISSSATPAKPPTPDLNAFPLVFNDWKYDQFCDALGREITAEQPLTLGDLLNLNPQRTLQLIDYWLRSYKTVVLEKDILLSGPAFTLFGELNSRVELHVSKTTPLQFYSNGTIVNPIFDQFLHAKYYLSCADFILPPQAEIRCIVGKFDSTTRFDVTTKQPTHLLLAFNYPDVLSSKMQAAMPSNWIHLGHDYSRLCVNEREFYRITIVALSTDDGKLASAISKALAESREKETEALRYLNYNYHEKQVLLRAHQNLTTIIQEIRDTVDQLTNDINQTPLIYQPYVKQPIIEVSDLGIPQAPSVISSEFKQQLEEATNRILTTYNQVAIIKQKTAVWQEFAPRYYEHFGKVQQMHGHLEITGTCARLWLPSQDSEHDEIRRDFHYSEKQYFDFRKFLNDYRSAEREAAATDPVSGWTNN